MTRITLDTSRDIATVPLSTRILRTIDTPSGPATETSNGWFVAPYASLINVGGQLRPNSVTTESAASFADGRPMGDYTSNGYELVDAQISDPNEYPYYWRGWDTESTAEQYENATLYGTGYEGDRFVWGGMGLDRVQMFTTTPRLQTNSVGMSKWQTPAGHEVITFGVEQLDFLDSTKSVSGVANDYEWVYTDSPYAPGEGFRVFQFDDLGEIADDRAGIGFAYVHQNIGDWSTKATRVGEQWYYVEPGKTTAVDVPEYLIGQDTGYQFSSTGELLREIPWATTAGTPEPAPAPDPLTPEIVLPPAPAPNVPLTPVVSTPAASSPQAGNTINITINGDGNTFGDIIIGVKNGGERLRGTAGDDVITSNRGKDKLTGLDGADEFVIAGDGKDRVTDYDESEGDTLAVDKPLVNDLDSTELVVVEGRRDFVASRDDSLVYREDKGRLYSDGDMLAKLNGNPDLTAVEVV